MRNALKSRVAPQAGHRQRSPRQSALQIVFGGGPDLSSR
ncbi:hypothetical protein EBBID32_23550 [Sphingobium indicum BiD32]|uniref:Uncharacterized protein n=1 Tax=Sphingobium indicum BiD32 TaxID=1301087 RepID=N1ML84_9SPHN|nr:hypothetical protein EBBID32_23550 [Sphingobium indicum BiD32]